MYTNDTHLSQESRILYASVDYKMALKWAPTVYQLSCPFLKSMLGRDVEADVNSFFPLFNYPNPFF